MKFSIGDRVQSISTKRRGTVRGILGYLVAVELDDQTSGVPIPKFGIANGLFLMEEDYEKISTNKILITSDGKTTLARLYDGEKVTRSAETKCSPTDTYDFATGANLAYDRLMRPTPASVEPYAEPAKALEAVKLYCVKSYDPGHWCTKGKIYEIDADGGITHDDGWVEIAFLPFMRRGGCIYGEGTEWKKYLVPLVPRPAKAGDWVMVTKPHSIPTDDNGTADYKKDDIIKIIETDGCWFRYAEGSRNGRARVLTVGEYEVLDGYDGRYEQTEPQYWSGKVVCVEARCPLTNSFTAGKVYTFENGKVADNDGDARPLDDAMETLAGWNEEYGGIAKFVEYKGEAT